MDIVQARVVHADPTPWPRAAIVLALKAALDEVDRVESHAAEAVRQQMLSAR